MAPKAKGKLTELRIVRPREQGRTTYVAFPKSHCKEYQRATYESGIITFTPIETSKEE